MVIRTIGDGALGPCRGLSRRGLAGSCRSPVGTSMTWSNQPQPDGDGPVRSSARKWAVVGVDMPGNGGGSHSALILVESNLRDCGGGRCELPRLHHERRETPWAYISKIAICGAMSIPPAGWGWAGQLRGERRRSLPRDLRCRYRAVTRSSPGSSAVPRNSMIADRRRIGGWPGSGTGSAELVPRTRKRTSIMT
jgi:hypothetical protein